MKLGLGGIMDSSTVIIVWLAKEIPGNELSSVVIDSASPASADGDGDVAVASFSRFQT